MRIFNLARVAGKTTRMLYASEFEKAPILCRGLPDKGRLMDKAKDMGLDIPEPITVNELFAKQKRVESGKILVDEALAMLNYIIEYITHGKSSVIGVTISDEKNSQIIERL